MSIVKLHIFMSAHPVFTILVKLVNL